MTCVRSVWDIDKPGRKILVLIYHFSTQVIVEWKRRSFTLIFSGTHRWRSRLFIVWTAASTNDLILSFSTKVKELLRRAGIHCPLLVERDQSYSCFTSRAALHLWENKKVSTLDTNININWIRTLTLTKFTKFDLFVVLLTTSYSHLMSKLEGSRDPSVGVGGCFKLHSSAPWTL